MALVLPIAMLIMGLVASSTTLIGLAGLTWALAFVYLFVFAAPIGLVLQSVAGSTDGAGRRYVSVALQLFAIGMMFALAMTILPIHNNRGVVMPAILAAIVAGTLAVMSGRGNVFRRIAKTTAGLVLVLAVFSFFFPRTTDRVRETIKKADAEGIQSVLPSPERRKEFVIPLLGEDTLSELGVRVNSFPRGWICSLDGPEGARAHFEDGTSGPVNGVNYGVKPGYTRFTDPAGKNVYVECGPPPESTRLPTGLARFPAASGGEKK